MVFTRQTAFTHMERTCAPYIERVQTYTIEGGDGDERGIIPRAIEDIFEHIERTSTEEVQYTVRVSFLQVSESLDALLLFACYLQSALMFKVLLACTVLTTFRTDLQRENRRPPGS